MPDVFDKETRSSVMAKVRSKRNKSTELRLIEVFRARGITGWRRDYPVKGRPDFVFPKRRIAVFTDGCFWHGHDCRNTRPAENEAFWAAKRKRNMARDKAVTERFERRGWTVLRIWECELKKKNLPALFEKLDALFAGQGDGGLHEKRVKTSIRQKGELDVNGIALMVAEHENILRFNQTVRNACAGVLEGKEVCVEDFRSMISFARNYADKHHHGKEEQILFKEMVDRLGKIGENLITHGMLIEHDFGRLFISELEAAVNRYDSSPTVDATLDIIANAIGYTKLLQRHIDRENQVVYAYADQNLAKEVLDEIDEKTAAFEKQAEADGVQMRYHDLLSALARKYKV